MAAGVARLEADAREHLVRLGVDVERVVGGRVVDGLLDLVGEIHDLFVSQVGCGGVRWGGRGV
ncbi:hypothetical protein ACGFYV_10235 [Streptomyces sp. NPDC048297]|uniref:hypothetical protein n=1 Tax=Streptomyces sp. NPDC048297 TaxID=3365531 RepID=UPI00371FBFE8